MMKKYVHIIIGSMAVAFLLWLTVVDVEQRWADSHVVLGWGTLVMLALAIILHLPCGGKLLRWSWTDMVVATWMIYVVGRVWMGNEYACGTEFLKMMEMGLLYVALKGILSWTQLSPTYIIYGILLCGVYEAGLGVWQLVSGTSRHSLYLMTGSFQNPGPYSAYLMMAVVLSMTLSRHGNGEIVSEQLNERHGHEVRISLNLDSNNQFSLSISSASAAILKATTSKSEKRGTGPRRTIFPFSLTNSLENCLHISKKFTNFLYKLHITRI